MANLNAIPVGTVVGIRKDSPFYGESGSNPANVSGVVCRVNEGDLIFGYKVEWDNGTENSYSRADLKYWKGKRTNSKRAEKKGPTTLEEAVKKAIKGVADKWSHTGSTGCFAFVLKDKEIKYTNFTACHADALRGPYGDKSRTHAIVTLIRRDAHKKEEVLPYFHWLLNDSPWAQAFIEKDANAAYDAGSVTVTPKAPANMVQGALIATRHSVENLRRTKIFSKLIDMGVEGNLAFIACSSLVDVGDGVVGFSVHGGGHYAIQPGAMNGHDVRDFLKGTPQTLTDPYEERGSSTSVHAMFSGGGNGKAESLRDWTNRLLKAAASGSKKSKNPFSKAKASASTAGLQAPLARVADLLREGYGKV